MRRSIGLTYEVAPEDNGRYASSRTASDKKKGETIDLKELVTVVATVLEEMKKEAA